MLETIKTVGSFVGLVTGAFVLWDRWLRGRPRRKLSVTVRTGGTPADPNIRITNPGPTDVLIRSASVYPAGVYALAKGRGSRATMAALGDATVEGANVLNVLLPAGGEHDFAIIDRRLEGERKRWVCFVIYWRKTSSTRLPQFPLVIHTSTDNIQHIIKAASDI